MIDAVGALTTVAVAVLASAVTYGIQVRSTHLADASGRALADSRLVEAVQLLLPPLQSGKMMPSNMIILAQRVEKLDDPLIVGAYRRNTRILQLIGQVQIAVSRMSITAERGESRDASTKHYAQVGIENALLAISGKVTRSYAEGLAKECGFKPVSEGGPVVLARVRGTLRVREADENRADPNMPSEEQRR